MAKESDSQHHYWNAQPRDQKAKQRDWNANPQNPNAEACDQKPGALDHNVGPWNWKVGTASPAWDWKKGFSTTCDQHAKLSAPWDWNVGARNVDALVMLWCSR